MNKERKTSAITNVIVAILIPLGLLIIGVAIAGTGKTKVDRIEKIVCPTGSDSCQKCFVRYEDSEPKSFEYKGKIINIDFCNGGTCFEKTEESLIAKTWEIH